MISVKQENSFVRISVKDEGQGIRDDIKDKIFNRFYLGDSKIVDSHRSLGLGLSLCKTIVKAHNGTIEVLDNDPKGSIFTFTLPMKEVEIHE